MHTSDRIPLLQRFWPRAAVTLRAHAFLWTILPLSLLMALLFTVGIFGYQRILTALLLDRHRQLASLAAVSVSEVVDGYSGILETLASDRSLASPSPTERQAALSQSSPAGQVFNAGLLVADRSGAALALAPDSSALAGLDLAGEPAFQTAIERQTTVFSGLRQDAGGRPFILVVTPLVPGQGTAPGVLVGAIDLQTAALNQPVGRLITGNGGLAYLVDQDGRVLAHPDRNEIGADYSSRPFVISALAGESGSELWRDPAGERLLEAIAPVERAGWSLVVQESWAAVAAPAQFYGGLLSLAGLGAILVVTLIAWRGVSRIVEPIRLLAGQTNRLAREDSLEPFQETGIQEIDRLERDFSAMATQVAAYRAGLRRYVGAITQSQEEERRRIARELHDETVQNLLAIARRLELYQGSESDPGRLERLAELQTVVTETLQGVRQISRDLRPLVLEDLGLIPAMRALLRAAHQGEGALAHIKIDLNGEPVQLSGEQELALYRITQEALNNIRKHARATGVRVALAFTSADVRLEISDDGQGFQAPAALAELTQRGSFGLMGIQERVWALDGSLEIQSTPGEGTRLRVCIPIGRGA